MKKPKKEQIPIGQTNGSSHLTVDQSEIDRLCKGFVDSVFYRKAMAEPGYMREQAISDFLASIGFLKDFDKQPEKETTLSQWVERILKNYYRAF